MGFSQFEDYGIYAHGGGTAKSVPKQRTAADDWSRLSDEDRADVEDIRATRAVLPLGSPAIPWSAAALTYVRRHG